MRNLGIEPHPYEIAEIEDRLRREEDPESEKKPKAMKTYVSQEDFTKIMVKKMTAQDSTSDGDLGRAFTMLDRDGSGEIDKEEFTYILENLGCNFKQYEIDQMVKEADTSGDGKIDKQEFIVVMKARSGKMDGVNYVAAMREQLRRYIQKEELKGLLHQWDLDLRDD